MSPLSHCMQTMPELSEREFRLLSRLIYEQSGISLGEHKQSLVRARLARRLRALGIPTFKNYYEYVTSGDEVGQEIQHLLDAISTNLTEFFREPAHFEYLSKVFFPRWKKEPQVRILSAGCSTGEEPYSIAICTRETLGAEAASRTRIFAGDICSRALARAKAGIYELERVKAISGERLRESFLKGIGSNAGLVSVSPELRSFVEFFPLNLTDTFPLNVTFHAIFCRNVAIYFDRATRASVFEKLGRQLAPGGTLFVGHAESMSEFSREYEYVQPSVYLRKR
jgi:chemotaxis protein methyltransferase CheR